MEKMLSTIHISLILSLLGLQRASSSDETGLDPIVSFIFHLKVLTKRQINLKALKPGAQRVALGRLI
jgi:hypothetical protein